MFLLQKTEGDVFGRVDLDNNTITLANFVKVLGFWRKVEDWEKVLTFYHELIHILQNEANMPLDENEADIWAKCLYEYYENLDTNNVLFK